jgi:hypothetical protein
MAIRESAPPAALLDLDDAEPWADPAAHPAWQGVISGAADTDRVRSLVLKLYPVFTGRSRYIFSSKVSRLEPEDARAVFAEVHRSLTEPDADADAGWRALASELGITESALVAAVASPSPAAADLVATVREHGHRSAPEGVGVAFALERRLPGMFAELAEALTGPYGVGDEGVAHLRYRGRQAEVVVAEIDALAARYLHDPWQVYEARRAGREALFCFACLLDEAGAS